jgi:signal transduction histidine kinase
VLKPPIRLQRLLKAAATPEGRGRLGDFRFVGRAGPVAAFAVLATALFLWKGWDQPVVILLKLWTAYSFAFAALALLAKVKGRDAGWAWVLPVATVAVAVGGAASAAIALAPRWPELLVLERALPEWALGAAFSAFFVGLSLATSEVRRRDQVASDARRQLLETRLQTLTAQIEPHFLMNTLANLRYLIKTDSRAAAKMLDHLADFLQGALERSRAPRSTLGQELSLVESYLSIMQIRMGERLRFATSVPAELHEVPFPPLLLQTLVENAVTHGIEPHGGAGSVSVAARRDGARIILSVTDDGVGFDGSATGKTGLGLHNTRERLDTFFDGKASLEIAAGSASGTVAAISIPVPAAAVAA